MWPYLSFYFSRPPLRISDIMARDDYCERKLLIKTALGEIQADSVIRNGKVVDVYTRELLRADVAIKGRRIAVLGDAKHTIGKGTKIIDARGHYLVPGLMDPHWHPESTMVTIGAVARVLVPAGITSIYVDAHEISAVLGVKGVKLLIEDGKRSPLKTFVCPPIHVPQTPKVVTTGSKIGAAEIKRLVSSGDILGVAEVAGNVVTDMRPAYAAGFMATFRARKTISGHSSGLTGKELNAFVAAGVQDCHDAVTIDEATERLRLGLKVIAREGTEGKYLDKIIGLITERKADSRHFMLCTDDQQPDEIVAGLALDHAVRKAIGLGVDPVTAIQMVTINPAEHFGLSRNIGSITPGRCADIIFAKDLKKFKASKVMADGKMVAAGGRMIVDFTPYHYPRWARSTIKVRRKLVPGDLKILAKSPTARVRVMKMVHFMNTEEVIETLKTKDGSVLSDPSCDVLKIIVVERHRASGRVGVAFVQGFKLKSGAIASTYCPDHHNIISVGTNDEEICAAVNALADMGGGYVATRGGRTVGGIEMPIAGLMSPEPIAIIADKLTKLNAAVRKELGSTIASPFIRLMPLSLACCPELRITERGLVRSSDLKLLPVVVG